MLAQQIRTYSSVPNSIRWFADSYVLRGRRSADPVLRRIDGLVWSLQFTNSSDGKWLYLLGELYFATNHWLTRLKQMTAGTPRGLQVKELIGGGIAPGREPAVRALCRCTIRLLSTSFNCTIQTLPAELEVFYGKNITHHGRRTDESAGMGKSRHLTVAEREQYRLVFKNGRAHAFNWWVNSKAAALEPADTTEMRNTMSRMTSELDDGYSFFVMNMSRDLYMGFHVPASIQSGKAVFHSAYTQGNPVQCAGSMWIEGGVVKGIKPNSGHYQPTPQHLVNLLEMLKLYRVDLERVNIFPHDKPTLDQYKLCNGAELLAEHGNYAGLLTRHESTSVSMQDAHHRRTAARRLWESFTRQEITLGGLTMERYATVKAGKTALELSRYAGANRVQWQEGLWKEAWEEVCTDLAMFDPKFRGKFKTPPARPS